MQIWTDLESLVGGRRRQHKATSDSGGRCASGEVGGGRGDDDTAVSDGTETETTAANANGNGNCSKASENTPAAVGRQRSSSVGTRAPTSHLWEDMEGLVGGKSYAKPYSTPSDHEPSDDDTDEEGAEMVH
jgi:hypothetical protein